MPHSKKLPKAAPRRPSTIPAANPGNRTCSNLPKRMLANPSPGGTNAENSNPAANPGQFTTSGSSRTRKSVTVKTIIKQVKNNHFTVVCVIPNSRNAATNSNPVASSISGYIAEIGAPQARHFLRNPRNADIQEAPHNSPKQKKEDDDDDHGLPGHSAAALSNLPHSSHRLN